MKILVPLADGFEETEAIATIDILRRANLSVTTAALDSLQVTGSHNISIIADTLLEETNSSQFNVIFLPGGPGADNLKNDARVIKRIKDIYTKNGYAAAICAAPTVLAKADILKDKKVTCFTGHENELNGGIYTGKPYEYDNRIITGQSAGATIGFALFMVKILVSEEEMLALRKKLHVYWQEI